MGIHFGGELVIDVAGDEDVSELTRRMKVERGVGEIDQAQNPAQEEQASQNRERDGRLLRRSAPRNDSSI